MALNTDTNFPPSGPAPYRIDANWCIGDSLSVINNNSFNFDNRLDSLETRSTAISAGVDTKVSKSGDTMTGGLNINANLIVRNTVTAGGANDSGLFVNDRNLNGTTGALYRSNNVNRLWDSAAGDVITYNSSGNVGIGTGSPQFTLDVAGTIRAQAVTQTGDCLVIGNDTKLVDINIANICSLQGWQNNDRAGIQLGSAGPTLYGSQTGNLGIGTTSPTTRLTIESAGTSYPNPVNNSVATIRVTNTTNNNVNAHALLSLNTTSANGGNPFISFDVNGITGWTAGLDNADSDKFKIANSWSELGTNTRLTITTSGNVGINTANPQQALHVQGNVRVGDATLTQPSGSAPMFACRAWVNFDATRNAAGGTDSANTNRFIRASGNISSVLQVAVGDYRITFTTAMPTTDYCVTGIGSFASAVGSIGINTAEAPTTTTVRVRHGHFAGSGATGYPSSPTYGNVAIFC